MPTSSSLKHRFRCCVGEGCSINGTAGRAIEADDIGIDGCTAHADADVDICCRVGSTTEAVACCGNGMDEGG